MFARSVREAVIRLRIENNERQFWEQFYKDSESNRMVQVDRYHELQREGLRKKQAAEYQKLCDEAEKVRAELVAKEVERRRKNEIELDIYKKFRDEERKKNPSKAAVKKAKKQRRQRRVAFKKRASTNMFNEINYPLC